MSKIFVIAGNRAEADQWIKGNLEKRKLAGATTLSWSDYVVVKDPTALRGYRNPSGYFIGTWKQRKDMDGIFQVLLMATDITSNRHRKLNQMWGEWVEANPRPTPKIINNPKGFTSMFGGTDDWSTEAAKMLSNAIDDEAMKQIMEKINGGNIPTP